MAIPFIKKGEIIRAKFINEIVEQVNGLAVNPPRDADGEGFPEQPDITIEKQDDTTAADILALKIRVQALEIMLLGGTWTEQSRTTDTLRVEDADDPGIYVDVQRITTVRLTHPLGGDITFSFTNP